MIRTYSELSKLSTFEERYEYLKLNGAVGTDTFGFDRYLNQSFYRSSRWKAIRDKVIIRDMGCDLGIPGFDIHEKVIIHHMNPLQKRDIEEDSEYLLNPEYLITTTLSTHNAIHYGEATCLSTKPIERSRNDTCPWRK